MKKNPEYPISNTECPMSKWGALRETLSQRRRDAKGIALFWTGLDIFEYPLSNTERPMSKWNALRETLSQRRRGAEVKMKADDNLFLTGLGIEAKHFSTLQLCNPVNPVSLERSGNHFSKGKKRSVNPVQNKAMPFAPLRLCEKLLNPVNLVNYVKPHPD